MTHFIHLNEDRVSMTRLIMDDSPPTCVFIEELRLGKSTSIRLSPEAQERLYYALGEHLERPLAPQGENRGTLPIDEMRAILEASGYVVWSPEAWRGFADWVLIDEE